MQKGQAVLWIVIGVLILAVAGGTYYLGRQTNTKPSYKACTMEAKICPDGSGVGRTGPNCEFAECPKPSPTSDASPAPTGAGETTNWKTYLNSVHKFSIKYPDNWYGQTTDSRHLAILTPNTPCHDCGGVSDGIFISAEDNQARLTSKGYLDQVVKPAQGGCGNLKIIDRPVSLKNLDVIIVSGFCGAGAPGPEAIISRDNYIIILSSELSSTIGEYIGVDYDTVVEIFSTFKFQ